jgi:hypothetical protein
MTTENGEWHLDRLGVICERKMENGEWKIESGE